MKLTEQQAQQLIEVASSDDPGPDALARILSHERTFDPRGSLITLLLRCFHEQEHILYGVWKNFREELSAPDSAYYVFRCDLCAASAPALPYVTAENHNGMRYTMCCPCAAALGVPLSSQARSVCPPPCGFRSPVTSQHALLALRANLCRLCG